MADVAELKRLADNAKRGRVLWVPSRGKLDKLRIALPLLLEIRDAAKALDKEIHKDADLRTGPVLVSAKKLAKLRAALAALPEGE